MWGLIDIMCVCVCVCVCVCKGGYTYFVMRRSAYAGSIKEIICPNGCFTIFGTG
jgi:hypothetical protein